MVTDELQGCGIVEMAWKTCWKTGMYIYKYVYIYIYIYMENLLGRLARKTCLGDLLGQNYPAYIYIYILRRLVWKACLEVLLG